MSIKELFRKAEEVKKELAERKWSMVLIIATPEGSMSTMSLHDKSVTSLITAMLLQQNKILEQINKQASVAKAESKKKN